MSATDTTARERILNALAAAVARDGYANAKVQEVAREAHVSLRTFYEEFESKEDCFLTLHHQLIEFAAGYLENAVTFDRPWREAMHEAFDIYFRLLTATPKLTAAMMLELTTLSDEGRAAREYARRRMCATMITLVDRGREANPHVASRPLDPLMAQCVLGAVVELVTCGIVDDDGDADRAGQHYADTATDLLWSVVTNVGEPAAA